MAEITIRHTHEEGTLIHGSRRGDGVYEIVRGAGFGYFPSLGMIGIRGSRDRDAQTWKIDHAKAALEAAGHAVTVEVDNQWRDPAAREADREQRSQERTQRLAERAEKTFAAGQDRKDAAQRTWDSIPFGQPILVGHHSERADRNRRERAHNNYGEGIELQDEARELARRSQAAESNQQYRSAPRVTMRRIAKLQAERRHFERAVAKGEREGYDTPRSQRQIERLTEEIAYWDKQLAESGFVTWSKSDFRPGDEAAICGRWYPVVRVNAKSLSIPPLVGMGSTINDNGGQPWSWTDTVPYDKVFGRRRDGKQQDQPGGEEKPVGG